MLPEAESTGYTRSSTTTAYDYNKDEGGFWASLGDLFLPDDDRCQEESALGAHEPAI